jgi:phospholipase/lecithinase/hemolysin
MATFQSLIDGFEAATMTAIPSEALGITSSPQFISEDTVTAPSGGFSAVYAFGDSLSDAGNVSLGTLGVVPVSPPYSDGRFTNGNVWVQDLSQNLGLPPVKPSLAGGTDYAYGGAETGGTAVHAENPTDLPSQLGQFVAGVPNPSPTALYTVWAGSNDVLDIANSTLTPVQQQSTVEQAVANETNFITGLAAHGAKDIVVLNVPDLGSTPYEAARPATQSDASSLAQQYDSDLGASLQQLMASGTVSIDLIDTYALLDTAIANPAAYGFTNVTQPVWTGNLTDGNSGVLNATGAAQNGYLFFDGLHPTAAGHSLLAAAVTQSLTQPV